MPQNKFFAYLAHQKRFASHTLVAYKTDLEQFREFLSAEHETDFLSVTHNQIRDYIVSLKSREHAATSINRKISALRSFYKFLIREELMFINPMKSIKALKIPAKLPVFIEEQKMDQLLDSEVFDGSFKSLRDKLIIEILFGTGIRLAELIGLKESDVDHYAQTIKVMGKRSKERIIPITSTLNKLINIYLVEKNLQDFNNIKGSLIVNDKGADAYPKLIYRIVHKYLTIVSTQDKKSPHVLRHSYATSLLNNGADLNAIKELLGHSGLAATQVYVHNSVERLKSIYKLAHPKA